MEPKDSPDPFLSQISPLHPLHSYFQINFNISFHLRLCCPPSNISPSVFPNKSLYKPPLSPIHAKFPTHLVRYLINRIIFGEECRSLIFSLCSFLRSSFPRPSKAHIFSSASHAQAPSAYVPPTMWETKFHNHTKEQTIFFFQCHHMFLWTFVVSLLVVAIV